MNLAALSAAILLYISSPPTAYDHPTVMHVWHQSPAQVENLCKRFGAPLHRRVFACTAGRGENCVVILPRGVTKAASDRLFRHERGHCNGWRH